MTISSPASPKRPSSIDSAAATASAAVCAMITPLPAASPLAFTTIGARCAASQSASKFARVNLR